jgi:hypothetical protein
MFWKKGLERIFGPKRDELQKVGENTQRSAS